jgi:hypothetical protein
MRWDDSGAALAPPDWVKIFYEARIKVSAFKESVETVGGRICM